MPLPSAPAFPLTKVSRLLVRAAEECILPLHRSAGLEVSLKSDQSVLTQADLACSRFLERELVALLPGSVVISEELPASHELEAELAWIIDPLDGTRTFSLGGVLFAVMVALAYRGQVAAAWIYRPARRSLLTFDGHVTRLDGRRILYSPSDLSWIGTIQAEHTPLVYPLSGREHKRVNLHSVANVESFRLALELSEFFATDYVTPWDTAAPVGIHLGMGGVVAYADGRPYDLGRTQHPLIFAKDQAQWDQVATLVKQLFGHGDAGQKSAGG